MNKIILSFTAVFLISSCSNNLPSGEDIVTVDGSGQVCDAETGLCSGTAKGDVFRHATINNKTSVLNKNYPAPEIMGLENWINSEGYSSLDELKGQVVLIDFWTLGCVNCIRTLPHLVETYNNYSDEDFEIIAVHAPEFAYERKIEAVARAVKKYNLPYPVAQDNDFMTWRAYKNRYWPAHYLIDKKGNVRYTHFGEGQYEEMRQAIEELLAE